MKVRAAILISILSLAAFLMGCGGSEPPTNSAATNANQPVAVNPLETNKKPEAPTTNEAPILGPVYKAYCTAIVKKDDAALRKVYSAETLKILDADVREEKKASLVELLAELDKITDAGKCVARNESIDASTGSADLKSETMKTWVPIEFVKENGEWKLTNKSADLKSVKESANTSNTAK